VCANTKCPNYGGYYGSSHEHGVDLRVLKHRDLKGVPTGGTRADCPECHRTRKWVKTRVVLPMGPLDS
jgi:hypothetical protein